MMLQGSPIPLPPRDPGHTSNPGYTDSDKRKTGSMEVFPSHDRITAIERWAGDGSIKKRGR